MEQAGKTTVLPGRSFWVWGFPNKPTTAMASTEWAAEEQVVQDAVASTRGEFSALAERLGFGGYAVAGRLEEFGDAATFGAPELMRGGYREEPESLELNLAWDPERVSQLKATGSPASLRGLIESIKAALLVELGTIAGE